MPWTRREFCVLCKATATLGFSICPINIKDPEHSPIQLDELCPIYGGGVLPGLRSFGFDNPTPQALFALRFQFSTTVVSQKATY